MLSSAQKISLAISLGVHGLVAAVVLAWPGVHPATRTQQTEMPILHLIVVPDELQATAAAVTPAVIPLVTPVAPVQPPPERTVEMKPEPAVAKIELKPEPVVVMPATIVETKASARPLAVASGPAVSSSSGVSGEILSGTGSVAGTNRVPSAGVAKIGVFKAARVKSGAAPEPVYPVAARRRRMEGNVLLLVGVGENGDAAQVQVRESSGSSILDTAAVEAVRLWKFEPAQLDGRAVTSELEVPIRFQLTW